MQPVGSLRISKLIDDPSGGYIGGRSKTFSGSYDCGPGFSGLFSTLTNASPVTISGIPAGSQCVVFENPPTGGLLNLSFAWAPAMVSPSSVEIAENDTAGVTITNPVIQQSGPLTVSVQVSGATGAYTGGTARVFPATYTCTLTNGPTTSGSVSPTVATPVVTSPIPSGSVCTVTMPLVQQAGDFVNAGYLWSGTGSTPPSAVIQPVVGGSILMTASYAAIA